MSLCIYTHFFRDKFLTRSLNKRQTICTMAREVLMFHMAHVGLPQAQFAQKYF